MRWRPFRLILLYPLAALAQPQPRAIALGTPTAQFSEEFTQIGALRELADGSLLIADPKENLLKHLDPRTGRAEVVGHAGDGPLEYRVLTALVALRGDSTLLYDGAGARWLVLSGARILGRAPPDKTAVRTLGAVIGSDTLGHVLAMAQLPGSVHGPDPRLETLPESAAVAVTTVTGTPGVPIGRFQTGVGFRFRYDDPSYGRNVAMAGDVPLAATTQAVAFPDGWIAIALSSPYHVEWRRPDGSMIRGPALPILGLGVDAWLAAIPAHYCIASESWAKNLPWPARLPGFVGNADARCGVQGVVSSPVVLPAPDGKLLVRRIDDPAAPPIARYDVIDRTGALVGTLSLPDSERVVGSGARSVYIAARDADDILRIRRFAWPPL